MKRVFLAALFTVASLAVCQAEEAKKAEAAPPTEAPKTVAVGKQAPAFKIKDAARIYRRLLESGVIVRPIASYDMPDYLRVSIGLRSQNEKFLSALQQALT